MVLGYPFLLRHRPLIDWHARTLLFVRRNRQHLVYGYPGEGLTEDALAAVKAVPTEELALESWLDEPDDSVEPIVPQPKERGVTPTLPVTTERVSAEPNQGSLSPQPVTLASMSAT